jgi:hypothetical protein
MKVGALPLTPYYHSETEVRTPPWLSPECGQPQLESFCEPLLERPLMAWRPRAQIFGRVKMILQRFANTSLNLGSIGMRPMHT